jgi:hypothetical protein
MLQNFNGCLRAVKPVHLADCLRGKVHGSDLKTVTRKLTRVVTTSGTEDDHSSGNPPSVLKHAFENRRRAAQIPASRFALVVPIPLAR